MTVLVPVALFGWIPLILILFILLPARRAVFASFLIGWMFLPIAGYDLPGLPDYTKVSATNIGVLLGVLIFDSARLFAYRFRLVDIPMAIWCLSSLASSMSNGLGVYDGLSTTADKVIFWGLPYFIGRVYLTDLRTLREAAVALFIGGLIYMPLCLLEARISPQLHKMIYGFFQHDFQQAYRFGGFRPFVFMQHGLMVSMWMATASLAGLWLWQSGSLRRLWGIPTGWLVAAMLVTTLICRSVNAMALLMAGIAVLYATRWFRVRLFMLALIAVAPVYVTMRINGTLDGAVLVSVATNLVGEERAESLGFRLDNEDLLVGKAMKQPVFGWAGWNRMRVENEEGEIRGVTDGLWVIAIGQNGLVGLVSIIAALLLPSLLLLWRLRVKLWEHPLAAGAAVVGVVAVLHMIDNLPNAMFNPVSVLCAGGLASLRRRAVTAELEEWSIGPLLDGPPAYAGTLYGYDDLIPPYVDAALPATER